MREPSAPIRALLTGAIDYAGLFPPAALPMDKAVREYASYRAGPDHWALGRFVVTAARLGELEAAADTLLERGEVAPWPVAALLGEARARELEAIGELNCRHAGPGAGRMAVDVVETRATSATEIRTLKAALPSWVTAYIEIPIDGDPAPLVGAIGESRLRAKVRTGGVTADAFPTAIDLARFLSACVEADVPLKATAGLHHPIRATYRLTYAPDSASGTMYGFLNVMLATAALRAGATLDDGVQLLEETDITAFTFETDAVRWRTWRLATADLLAARQHGAVSFGSCSFREPLDDLAGLGLL